MEKKRFFFLYIENEKGKSEKRKKKDPKVFKKKQIKTLFKPIKEAHSVI